MLNIWGNTSRGKNEIRTKSFSNADFGALSSGKIKAQSLRTTVWLKSLGIFCLPRVCGTFTRVTASKPSQLQQCALVSCISVESTLPIPHSYWIPNPSQGISDFSCRTGSSAPVLLHVTFYLVQCLAQLWLAVSPLFCTYPSIKWNFSIRLWLTVRRLALDSN